MVNLDYLPHGVSILCLWYIHTCMACGLYFFYRNLWSCHLTFDNLHVLVSLYASNLCIKSPPRNTFTEPALELRIRRHYTGIAYEVLLYFKPGLGHCQCPPRFQLVVRCQSLISSRRSTTDPHQLLIRIQQHKNKNRVSSSQHFGAMYVKRFLTANHVMHCVSIPCGFHDRTAAPLHAMDISLLFSFSALFTCPDSCEICQGRARRVAWTAASY